MKKNLLLISVATAGMIACNTSPKSELTKAVSYEDTVGFAAFQDWKAQHERQDPNTYYMQATQPAPAKPAVKQVVKYVPVAQKTTQASQPVAAKKKGWSKAAKGTAIGAGSGAVLGAVINKKNRVLGGVIGGVIGGGAGYAIGRGMDKKDGRY